MESAATFDYRSKKDTEQNNLDITAADIRTEFFRFSCPQAIFISMVI
jgi:hypothetical protein